MDDTDLHQETLVYVLVEAQNKAGAERRAKSAMDDVVDAAARPIEAFRDYQMFHGDDVARLRERWGDLPAAASLDTQEGAEMLEDAWEKTADVFEENLEAVEEILEIYAPEEIMKNAENARLHFLRLGATVGPSVPLYTENSYPIRDRDELDRYIESNGELWIVPIVGVS
jgi:hypothetical protein